MEAERREVEFARRLSVSDKGSRDRALKKLKTWLHARSQPTGDFGVDEMMKLWRGLHYCMWMSDKPLVQEECAKNISSLVHSLATQFSALRFVDCGWLTLCQEWHNIDRLRMDKYLMMIRHYLRQNFAYLQKHKWDTELVDEMLQNFTLGILDPLSEEVPVGMQLHLADIYVPVLVDLAHREQIPWNILERLLQPILSLAVKTNKPVVMKAVCQGVIEMLLELPSIHAQLSANGDSDTMAKESNGDEPMDDDDEEVEDLPPLKVDHGALAQTLFSLGSQSSVTQKARSALYLLKRRFDGIAVKHVPTTPTPTTADDSEVERSNHRASAAPQPSDDSSASEPSSPVLIGKKRKRKQKRKSPMESPVSPAAEPTLSPTKSPEPERVPELMATPTPKAEATTPVTDDGSPRKKKRIRLSMKDNQVKQFSKKDPIDVSPWKPTSKEGKSLLKNRTPTPITPRMRRILAQDKAKSESRRHSTGGAMPPLST
ncbi:ribosomal RNA processing protein 1 homolog A-like [Sycon ciliatum]|uniref:ribosomal RNA processing protein 1 homolog A-like n=1 Tax=Sycon ciliatum TaxID=27933 RepID=UPI0020AB0355|eukprot:scpid64877/ scgid28948/ Ribosomal RNA processing protein 1 homolog B; RRP1-like protein B